VGRSCTQHNGGDTCGPNANESCCTSIAVPKPSAAYTLDKYNITAGRFRVFIDKTKGDVRGYVQAHRPAWFESAWDPWLPKEMDDGNRTTIAIGVYPTGQGQDGVYQQLGPVHYGAQEQGGNEGCNTSQTGNARTYRLPDDINTSYFADTQQYTQDILDQKPQQCTTFFMFAAFCIWDGGRLASFDELLYAWEDGAPATHTYPWGNAPIPGGWNNAYPYDPTGQGFGAPAPPGSDMTVANYKYNFWMPKTMQCIGNDPAKCDYSVYIAPPGRFPKGNGALGHADLAGNVYDVALPMNGTAGTDPATRTVSLARTGAFDNHAIAKPDATFVSWKPYNKYLAVGARCSR
jgi:formylglycine-generating enzyme required for sulfatase activity